MRRALWMVSLLGLVVWPWGRSLAQGSRVVTSPALGAVAGAEGPQPSPRVLFDVQEDPKHASLYLANLPPDGNPVQRAWSGYEMAWGANYSNLEPEWSSDGHVAAFAWKNDQEALSFASGDPTTIAILPGASPPAAAELEVDPYAYLNGPHPGWHPSLPLFAYTEPRRGDLVLYSARTGRSRTLFRGGLKKAGAGAVADGEYAYQPSWLPDGHGLVFVDWPIEERGRSLIRRLSISGGPIQCLTPRTPGQPEYSPLPSPDGVWIAFSQPVGLFAMTADGQERMQLTRPVHAERHTGAPPCQAADLTDYASCWSSDSRRVYFSGPDGAGYVELPSRPQDKRRAVRLGKRLPEEYAGSTHEKVRLLGRGWRVGIDNGALWYVDERTDARKLVFQPERGKVTHASVWEATPPRMQAVAGKIRASGRTAILALGGNTTKYALAQDAPGFLAAPWSLYGVRGDQPGSLNTVIQEGKITYPCLGWIQYRLPSETHLCASPALARPPPSQGAM
jgi:hypothetical protein